MHQDHLAQADGHLRQAEGIIARQKQCIRDVQAQGQDTDEAEALLRQFIDILAVFKRHRELILAALAAGGD